MAVKNQIQEIALKYFDLFGVAAAGTPITINHYEQWLKDGHHGEMQYLERHKAKKKNPELVLPGAKSWLSLGLIYDSQEKLSIDLESTLRKNKKGWVARYARGEDYHFKIESKLQGLVQELQALFPREAFWYAVDTKPVLERDVARAAGLGWVGKNTCLINKEKGSFLFLAEVLTTLNLPPDKPVMDHCGSCQKCLEACPTGALTRPHHLDARLCLSYWTIESKSNLESAPQKVKSNIGVNLFGCDICQDVCPWNSKSRRTNNLHEPLPSPWTEGFDLKSLVSLGKEQVEEKIKSSALERAGSERLQKNAAFILNSLDQDGSHQIS